jgi:hypothetical protein
VACRRTADLTAPSGDTAGKTAHASGQLSMVTHASRSRHASSGSPFFITQEGGRRQHWRPG